MLNLSIDELQEKVMTGELTYEALTIYYLERIKAYNDQVNAVSELNPNALESARALDQEFKAKGLRSSLHGIPVMIKDNINIASDGFHTTAGAYAFEDMVSTYDAFIVTKLKEAGAIILGKTNLTEFANFISDTSPNGYSALKGQVKNPYGQYDVGGSSSGSGVAVACGFCQVAIGTETSGSIISPASSNSVIGLKPSVGLVSRHGIIPISGSQDIPGPMGRHIGDVRHLQSVIEGFDVKDATTKVVLQQEARTLTSSQPLELKKLRLGIYEGDGDRLDGASLIFDEAIKVVKSYGALTEVVNFDPEVFNVNWDVLYYEFSGAMKAYLATMTKSTPLTSLEDIVSFNQRNPDKYIPYDQKQFITSLEKEKTYKNQYEKVLRDSYQYGQLIDRWLEAYGLDVICYVNCDGTDIGARNGHPSLTFPIGYTSDGQPVGFTMTGPLYSEPLLLALADHLIPVIGDHKDVVFELS